MDEQKRNRLNLWMFPLGTVGRDMTYALFTNFLFTYVLFTRQLDAAQLSAITAIDAQIYEAATIDGASKMQQAFRITIPSLLPTLVLMLTVRLGSIMSGGFDQVLAFYNPTVYKSADILGTFVYRQGIGSANFSYASAVGLFESVVGLIFVSMSNVISKRLSGRTVW